MEEVKRRRWTIEQKRAICAETRQRGKSISEVSRRHGVNANLVFKWLRDPRFVEQDNKAQYLLPVEVFENSEPLKLDTQRGPTITRISIHGGHSIDVAAETDPNFLGCLLKAWLR
jgi:transposase